MRKLGISVAAVILVLAGCGDDDGGSGPLPDLKAVSLNILHGLSCDTDPENCRLEERVDLVFDLIEDAGCPDVVVLQEVLGPPLPLVEERAASRCPFSYEVVNPPFTQNVTLSRYPVVETNADSLHGVRFVSQVRIDHPIGLVDVFNTHLAAGVDNGPAPCAEPCPVECSAAGGVSNRDCQAVQLANVIAARHDLSTPAVLAGDFNATPDTFVYDHLISQGYIDAFLAAGNAECDPATSEGCTSGREDSDLSDMESPEGNTNRRIDYLFVVPPVGMSSCDFEIDSSSDGDGDGLGTHIFADDPNPFAMQCGPLPDPICWPSDHEGMQIDLNCRN
jgi:endonuclease/exonuclease/phosphatase family metal-dependent hydrolase